MRTHLLVKYMDGQHEWFDLSTEEDVQRIEPRTWLYPKICGCGVRACLLSLLKTGAGRFPESD